VGGKKKELEVAIFGSVFFFIGEFSQKFEPEKSDFDQYKRIFHGEKMVQIRQFLKINFF
jgi:hypothetical protein